MVVADFPRPFGPYLLLKSLGTGGTGDVFLARPQEEGRGVPSPVVIKRLHGQLATQSEFVKRFHHEGEIAVAIDSPHVAKVFDVGRIDDTFYIAMEYLAGWTVGRVIKDLTEAGGSASIASVADVVRGALSGLSALHRAKHPQSGQSLGIIHRDIAPKNLMIGEDGITRLIDLGLGKSNLQDWRTGTGVVMGSPGYMAPEQVIAEGVDQRSDLYAMGIVLWELLTLKRYIKRAPVPIMLRAQVKPTYLPPSHYRSEVPGALDRVAERALQLDPAARFQTAGEFIAALDAAVPPRDEEEPLATIVGDMLWGELGQAKTEVTKLLSVLPSDPIPRVETVEVFAQRAVEEMARATPTPLAFATPLQNTYLAQPRSGVPLAAVLALMGLTLLIGLGIGVLLLSDRTVQPIASSPIQAPPEPAPKPAVAPVVTPEPIAAEEKVADEPIANERARPPPKRRSPRRERKKAKVERSDPPPAPADAPRSDRDRLLALMRRARDLGKKVSGTPKEEPVKGLLAKAAQEASASEVNTKVLAELEAMLRTLEKE